MEYIFSFFIFLTFEASINNSEVPVLKTEISTSIQTTKKEIAFNVLREKCNICHATKKRTDIFTLENMDSLAADINKQVFVKRKMPKGRKVKLTEEERNQLKTWLDEMLMEK